MNEEPTAPSDLRLIEQFRAALVHAQDQLKNRFAVVGRTGLPVGALAGMSRTGDIERQGLFESGDEFSFHGAGCRVLLEDGTEIDFDWDSDGRQVFDPWRLAGYLESRGLNDEATRAGELLDSAARHGLITAARGGFYYFTDQALR